MKSQGSRKLSCTLAFWRELSFFVYTQFPSKNKLSFHYDSACLPAFAKRLFEQAGNLLLAIAKFPIKDFGNDGFAKLLTNYSNHYNLFNLSNHFNLKIFLLLISISFLSLKCKDDVIPPLEPTIKLVAEDASCTEVWLKLSVTNAINPVVALKRGDSLINTYILTTLDTTIVDENLLPGCTYTYTAQLLNGSMALGSTTQIHTMDTTSHDFTWQTFTLGDGSGSSCLYDVAIINDTLAYAVGLIYQGGERYNTAKWNGQTWQLLQFNYQGAPPEIKTIFAFNENDIWFDPWFHWDGQSINELPVDPVFIGVGVNKLWGSPSAGLYAVGNNGLIAHRGTDGVWRKIESPAGSGTGGMGLPLNDVWGGSNKWLGENVILIPASEKYTLSEKKLILIQNGIIKDLLPWPMQDRRIQSVWFNQNSRIFTSGGGIFKSKRNGKWEEMYFPLIYTNRIRGNHSNDLIVVGDFGIAGHYNGVYWKVYNELSLNGNYESVSIRDNIFIAVGYNNRNATAVIGRRN